MKKRILTVLGIVLICVGLLCPLYSYANPPLDPDAKASLVLHYQKEEKTFEGLTVSIYRVAEAHSNGTFELIEPYASYPIRIHDITAQEQWKTTAATLTAYIAANQLPATRQGTTDATGTVSFDQLQTGLYLVSDVYTEDNSGSYLFSQFMVYLPTPNEDGTYDYSVEANPKCISYVPSQEYRVTKLWQDTGKVSERPKEVTIDLYKDGVLQDTQTLSAANNWTYTWYASVEDLGVWTVLERSVEDRYTVTIKQNGNVFTVINTHQYNEDPPVKTGDSFSPMPWILAIAFSGLGLMLLGARGRKFR